MEKFYLYEKKKDKTLSLYTNMQPFIDLLYGFILEQVYEFCDTYFFTVYCCSSQDLYCIYGFRKINIYNFRELSKYPFVKRCIDFYYRSDITVHNKFLMIVFCQKVLKIIHFLLNITSLDTNRKKYKIIYFYS